MNTRQQNPGLETYDQFTPELADRLYRHHGVKITLCDGYEHTQPSITYKHAKYKEVSLKQIENQNNLSELNTNFHYFNNSHLPVTVKTRDNITVTLSPIRADMNDPHVLIRKEITARGNALDSLISHLSSIKITIDEYELSVLKQELSQISNAAVATVHIDYIIPVKELQSNKVHKFVESLYVQEVDVVLSLKTIFECPNHPMSTRNINRNYFGRCISQTLMFNSRDAYCVYRYINKDPKALPLYLYDGHTLIKLIPTTDDANNYRHKQVLEVSYSTRNYEGEDKIDELGMVRFMYTMDEAKKIFTIINTPEELDHALVDEDKIKKEMILLNKNLTTSKLELSDKELELAKKELEIEGLKLKNNKQAYLSKQLDEEIKRREKLENEQAEKIEKAEKKIREEYEYKYKLEKDKQQGERDKRKDNFDLIKSLVALLGSVLGIFMVYKKAKK